MYPVKCDHEVLWPEQRRDGRPPGDQAVGRRAVHRPQWTSVGTRGQHHVQVCMDDPSGLPSDQHSDPLLVRSEGSSLDFCRFVVSIGRIGFSIIVSPYSVPSK